MREEILGILRLASGIAGEKTISRERAEKEWKEYREAHPGTSMKTLRDYLESTGQELSKDFGGASGVAEEISSVFEPVVDINKEMKLPASDRKKGQKALLEFLKPTYFDGIPMEEIMKVLKDSADIEVVQEDGSRWSGMLLGDSAADSFDLGKDGKLINNTSLFLSWYKMPSGKMEVIGYLS